MKKLKTSEARMEVLQAIQAGNAAVERHCNLNKPISQHFPDEPGRHQLQGTLLITLTAPTLYPSEELGEDEAFINFNFTSARAASLRTRFNHSKSALRKYTKDNKNQVIGFFAGAVGGIRIRDKLNLVIERQIMDEKRSCICGIVRLSTIQKKIDWLAAEELVHCYAAGMTLNTSFTNWEIIPEDEVDEYERMDRESCQKQGGESWLWFKEIDLSEPDYC